MDCSPYWTGDWVQAGVLVAPGVTIAVLTSRRGSGQTPLALISGCMSSIARLGQAGRGRSGRRLAGHRYVQMPPVEPWLLRPGCNRGTTVGRPVDHCRHRIPVCCIRRSGRWRKYRRRTGAVRLRAWVDDVAPRRPSYGCPSWSVDQSWPGQPAPAPLLVPNRPEWSRCVPGCIPRSWGRSAWLPLTRTWGMAGTRWTQQQYGGRIGLGEGAVCDAPPHLPVALPCARELGIPKPQRFADVRIGFIWGNPVAGWAGSSTRRRPRAARPVAPVHDSLADPV